MCKAAIDPSLAAFSVLDFEFRKVLGFKHVLLLNFLPLLYIPKFSQLHSPLNTISRQYPYLIKYVSQGKIAIVTGASRSISAGIVEKLAKRGASVLVTHTTGKVGAEGTVKKIIDVGGICGIVQAEVASHTGHQEVLAEVLKLSKAIDILMSKPAFGDGMLTPGITHELFRQDVPY